MTKSARLAIIFCLSFAVFAVAVRARAQTAPSLGEQVAKAQGLDGFGQIDAIRFTFIGEVLGHSCLAFLGLVAQDRPDLLRG